jgi:hypothetical protein
VVAGVGVAHALGSASLLHSARTSFVQGMDTMLWACGGIALASAMLGLIFLPRWAAAPAAVAAQTGADGRPAGQAQADDGAAAEFRAQARAE